jgi:uncharacterized damage-inducible protein DinB
MKSFRIVLFTAVLALAAALPAPAQETPAFISDFLGNLSYTQGQVMALEGAVPAEKYSWRPAEGVRSIGEVYSHIAHGNYLIMQLSGIQPPPGEQVTMDEKKWEAEHTGKERIVADLRKSFEHVSSSAAKMTEADLAVTVDFFGTKMTKRAALIALLGHIHEHLGQSIAYARMNGIVPPWTAAEMAKQAEKEKGK